MTVLLFISGGCSREKTPKRYPVSGKVVFDDGEPVKTGVVEFIPSEGEFTANGQIQRDGTFRLQTINKNDGAVPGKYKVIVKQFIFYDKLPKHKHDHGGDVAKSFADVRTTSLEFEVRPEKNTADFEVSYSQK